MSFLEITRSNGIATVQDRGRRGYRSIGVGLGGALDDFGTRVVNVLVGNPEEAAVIESTFGAMTLRFADDRLVAWCGSDFAVSSEDEVIEPGRPALIAGGAELMIGAAVRGCRLWLAISGGIDVPLVLGSRATDLRSGFGGHEGRALRTADKIPLGEQSAAASGLLENWNDQEQNWRADRRWSAPTATHPILRIVPGSEWNEFDGEGTAQLTQTAYTVSNDSDRMGLRLTGTAISRRVAGEMLSTPLAPGTIQVPPSGQPIVLLNDCQTIGGYPKIAHVIEVDFPIAAQLCSGTEVRFEETTLAEAQTLLCERERDFERFRVGIALQIR